MTTADRGKPVAKLNSVDTKQLLEQLIRKGAISKPTKVGKLVIEKALRLRGAEGISDLIEQRRR